jgi:tetratricopeptide (TPR) repeat protein
MSWRGLAAALCLTVLLAPFVCRAQTSADVTRSGATVSARDLSIPEKARQNFNEGTHLLAARDWVVGIARFQQAISVFPGFYEAYYRIGIADAELKHTAKAESAFRKSIEMSGGRYAPPYFGLALLLCTDKQDCAGAERFARAGLGHDPNDAAGHFALAWILYVTNRLTDAEQSVRDTLVFQPDLAAAHRLLAWIQQRQSAQSASVHNSDAIFQ